MINSNKLSTDVHLTKKVPSFEVTPNQLWRRFWGVYWNSKGQGETGKSLMATPNYLSVFHGNNLTITTSYTTSDSVSHCKQLNLSQKRWNCPKVLTKNCFSDHCVMNTRSWLTVINFLQTSTQWRKQEIETPNVLLHVTTYHVSLCHDIK